MPRREQLHPERLGVRTRWTERGARIIAPVLVTLAVLALWKELPEAVAGVARAHPVALLSLVIFFVWNHVATLSWRVLLRATGSPPCSLGELVRLRIEAQAVNQVIPTAGAAGEALRAVGAARGHDVGPAALATVLDNFAGAIAGLGFAFAVGAAAVTVRAGEPTRNAFSGLAALGFAFGMLVCAVVLLFQLAPLWLPKLGRDSPIRKLLAPLGGERPVIQRALVRAVLWRFLERVLAVGEIHVVFLAVGAPISLVDAAIVSALLVIVSLTVVFVPGQLGAAEAAVAGMSVVLGLPASVGLAAALLRRARQLVVCLLGVTSLVARRRGPAATPQSPETAEAP